MLSDREMSVRPPSTDARSALAGGLGAEHIPGRPATVRPCHRTLAPRSGTRASSFCSLRASLVPPSTEVGAGDPKCWAAVFMAPKSGSRFRSAVAIGGEVIGPIVCRGSPWHKMRCAADHCSTVSDNSFRRASRFDSPKQTSIASDCLAILWLSIR